MQFLHFLEKVEARYNASVITSKETEIGEMFENIPEIYIIYISEFDFLKECKTIYHIEKIIKETGTLVDDGVHEILVKRVKFLKTSEGGTRTMCEVMEKYMAEAANEASIEANIKAVINMLRLKIDENEIKKLYPSEFEEGKRRFLEKN